MTYVPLACADCMEEAGGRQRHHRVAWVIDTCPVCGEEKAVTAPSDFGHPRLEPKVLPFTTDEKESA